MHSCLNETHLGIPAERKTRWGGKTKEKEGQRAVTTEHSPPSQEDSAETAVIAIFSPQRMLGNAAAGGKGKGGKQRSALGHKRRKHADQGDWKSGGWEKSP